MKKTLDLLLLFYKWNPYTIELCIPWKIQSLLIYIKKKQKNHILSSKAHLIGTFFFGKKINGWRGATGVFSLPNCDQNSTLSAPGLRPNGQHHRCSHAHLIGTHHYPKNTPFRWKSSNTIFLKQPVNQSAIISCWSRFFAPTFKLNIIMFLAWDTWSRCSKFFDGEKWRCTILIQSIKSGVMGLHHKTKCSFQFRFWVEVNAMNGNTRSQCP